MNNVLIAAFIIMAIGLAIQIGVFKRILNLTEEKDIKRLGIALIVVGFIVGLTQSTPSP